MKKLLLIVQLIAVVLFNGYGFAQADNPDLSAFSVIASNSIFCKKGSEILSGDLGVPTSTPGPWLAGKSEVTVGHGVLLHDGVAIYGDSIKIKTNGSVDTIYYNELNNNGTIRGAEYAPLQLPLDITLPDFPLPQPGTDAILLAKDETLVLAPGSYGEISAKKNTTLILRGGTYHLEELHIGKGAKLYFQDATELIINSRFDSDKNSNVMPDPGYNLQASDIFIYVNGGNGGNGGLDAFPKAVKFGLNSSVMANVYAPNGTIFLRKGVQAKGAFIGKDVIVGHRVSVELGNGFSNPNQPPIADSQTVFAVEDSEALITLSATDGDGDPLAYHVLTEPLHGILSGTAPDISYLPEVDYNGPDSLTFIASDGTEDSEIATVTIHVAAVNDTPVAVDDSYRASEDSPVTTGNVLNNDKLGDEPTMITAFDATSVNGGTVSYNGDITFDYTPVVDFSGTDTFTYTIMDSDAQTSTATVAFNVAPVNDPPIADIGNDQTVLPGETVNLNGSASDDVDGDPLTFSWSIVSMPAGSSAEISDPAFPEPSLVADLAGEYLIQLIVNDGLIDSQPVTVKITVWNIVISATPESIYATESSLLAWSAPDAETCMLDPGRATVVCSGILSVTPIESTTYTITASGPGGDASSSATVQVMSAPDNVYFGYNSNDIEGNTGLLSGSLNILNGNCMEARRDVSYPSPFAAGLAFEAFYNSRLDTAGPLGVGWTHIYNASLDPVVDHAGDTYLKIVGPAGRNIYFIEYAPDVYKGAFNEKTHVTFASDDYVWHRNDGSRYSFNTIGQLVHIFDPAGNYIHLDYDDSDRLSTVSDPSSGRTLTLQYDPTSGLLESVAGPLTRAVADGIWVTYGYDGNDNLTSVIYADGSGYTYGYEDPLDIHNLTGMVNSAGHLLKSWTHAVGDRCTGYGNPDGTSISTQVLSETQVEVTDAYGIARTYEITYVMGKKVLKSVTGPANPPYGGNTVRWEYDSRGNAIEVEYSGSMISRFQGHDVRGYPDTVVLAAGSLDERTLQFTYHPEKSAVLTRTEPSVLGGGDKVTTYDYDNDGNTLANQNPTDLPRRLIEQGFTYDAAGQAVSYEYVTELDYNTRGQVTDIDGPQPGSADTTLFSYSSVTGDLLSITRPLVGSTMFSNYDNGGRPGRVTESNNQSIDFIYDARGRTTSTTHAASGSSSTSMYNSAGLLDTSISEDGVITTYEYDPLHGRLSRTYDMNGNYIEYGYDAQGNMNSVAKWDARGSASETDDERLSVTQYSYQHPTYPGMLYREFNYDGTYTEYDYDAAGNTVTVVDPKGNATINMYDDLNRLITATELGIVVTERGYDAHGNMNVFTDPEGGQTTFTKDDMGRMVATVSPDSGTTLASYDEAGNRTSRTDGNNILVQYQYDELGRLTDIIFPTASQNVSFTYDEGVNAKGRRTGMTDITGSTTWGYDGQGRTDTKTTIIGGNSYTISRTFTPGGSTDTFTYPDGRIVNFNRDAQNKITQLSTTRDSTTKTLLNNIQYRPFGGVASMTNGAGITVEGQQAACSCGVGVVSPGNPLERAYSYDSNKNVTGITYTNYDGLSVTYDYDDQDRLIEYDGPQGRLLFDYDLVGNRLSKEIKRNDKNQEVEPGLETYQYEITSNRLDTIDASPSSTTLSYGYDNAGNITTIGDRTLIYNENSRLTRVLKDTTTLGQYGYNGLEQRAWKKIGTIYTYFLYDFNGNLIAEILSGTITREYIYSGSSRLAMVDVPTGIVLHYVNDKLGTPQSLVDENNIPVWSAKYLPFGEAIIDENPIVQQNFRFPGQYYDAETGLHYNYHRYYDPATGRYLTPDPVGLAGGMNLFLYADANPVRWSDPRGLDVYGNDDYPSPPGPHGLSCGAGSTASRIPDVVGGVDISDACDRHDECYATCDASKWGCDIKLMEDILSVCGSSQNCRFNAYLYFNAVQTFGWQPYLNAQRENCGECTQ